MLILLVQVLDPLRIALVVLALWSVTKLYDPQERLVPNLLGLLGVAVILSLILASTQILSRSMAQWAVVTLSGYLANLIIWLFVAGALYAYRQLRDH